MCEIPSYKKEHLYSLYVLEMGRLRHVLGDRTRREILEHWISEKMSVLLETLFVIRFIIKYTCFVICSILHQDVHSGVVSTAAVDCYRLLPSSSTNS